jgi:phosphate transport system substrate-binding protein
MSMHTRVSVLHVVLLAACAMLPASCGTTAHKPDANARSIRIKGSDTMLPLVQRWAAEFMRLHPSTAIYVEGGGTETGIEALIAGDVDLCSASRSLTPDEVRRLLEKRGSLGISVLTAKDALSVYLNPANPVRNLTVAQLRGIFTGRTRNWSELGGGDLPVTVFNRYPNSGTYHFFAEHVLPGEEYSSSFASVPTTKAVANGVRSNPGGIGFGGLAYGPDLVHCSIEGVAPTEEHVRDGSYPIARYLYFYLAHEPEGLLQQFIDWVLSDAGQAVVADVGYVPLWEVEAPSP